MQDFGDKVKKENIGIVLLKFGLPLLLAVFLYAAAHRVENKIQNRWGNLHVTAIPTAAPRPVFTPREFKDIEIKEKIPGTVLEYSDAVEAEYFADAVFAGDSLTDGFRIYDVGQHFEVISYVGLSPGTALYQPVYKTAEDEMLIMADAIRYMGARKAYILLGTNGLNWTSPESLISGYGDLIDQLMTTNPDTYFILQSVPPVTEATAGSRPSYDRERIEHYNNLVKELAIEKGVYFLDVYSAIVGEDGYLPTGIAAPDGIHMTPSGYRIWFEYITTHTIKGNAAFAMDGEGRIIPMKPVEPLPEDGLEAQTE